jgi:hypothetical protein
VFTFAAAPSSELLNGIYAGIMISRCPLNAKFAGTSG